MRAFVIAGLLIALGGCNLAESANVPNGDRPGKDGRYVGIGIYTPGDLWTQVGTTTNATGNDTAAATPDDDDQILVVTDTRTGEIRQCGNLSGRCLTMNPWGGDAARRSGIPASLLEHAVDLRREAAEADTATKRK